MADGKFFLLKIMEILSTDTELGNILGEVKVELAKVMPVGNTYPQICLRIDEGSSEDVFPAGRYRFDVTVWVEKESDEPYKTLQLSKQRINALLNRKADSLSEIDIAANEGLRVVRSLKNGGNVEFSKDVAKDYMHLSYDVVMSEDEDFTIEDAINSEWV